MNFPKMYPDADQYIIQGTQYSTTTTQHVHSGLPRICRNATEAKGSTAYAMTHQECAATQSISAMALIVLSFINANCLPEASIFKNATW